MKIEPFGQSAVLISFENEIDRAVHNKVIHLYERCKRHPEFTFLIPAYQSLTLGVDLNAIDLTNALQFIQQLAQEEDLSQTLRHVRKITLPVCYAPAFATDMPQVEALTQMDFKDIIQEHQTHSYRVFMLGFVAGFAYLGKLPQVLQVARKATPEKRVLAGSIGLAGLQTGIYPVDAPGGWQIIGRTPVSIFDASKDNPNFLRTGDEVSFRAISEDEFRLIEIKQEAGIYEPELEKDA